MVNCFFCGLYLQQSLKKVSYNLLYHNECKAIMLRIRQVKPAKRIMVIGQLTKINEIDISRLELILSSCNN